MITKMTIAIAVKTHRGNEWITKVRTTMERTINGKTAIAFNAVRTYNQLDFIPPRRPFHLESVLFRPRVSLHTDHSTPGPFRSSGLCSRHDRTGARVFGCVP